MTMTPRAKKFRLRPSDRLGPDVAPAPAPKAAPAVTPAVTPVAKPAHVPPPASELLMSQDEDGFGNIRFPTTRAPEAAAEPAEPSPEPAAAPPKGEAGHRSAGEELAAIRAEGLTGRQLRMARRVAQRNGIEATSDYEAVRLLRRRGIDPFQRASVLELVTAKAADNPDAGGRIQLPQTVPQKETLPSKELTAEDHRAREILRIQRDIAQRRRRKLGLLFARLAVFVFLPTVIAGWYFYKVGHAVLRHQIGVRDPAGRRRCGSRPWRAVFGHAVRHQPGLDHRPKLPAIARRDAAAGQGSGIQGASFPTDIDALQRLDPDATNEAAYRAYKRNVKIGYDPTEGIIKMEVIAADPAVSAAYSEALIAYAEMQVDHLTQRLREDQMSGARESYADAEEKVLAAQSRVLDIQEQLGVLDPATETGVVMAQVSKLEAQLQTKLLQLQQLMDNAQPNQARVDGVTGDIERLELAIDNLRSSLTQSVAGGTSLASVTGQLRIAEADLTTRQLMLSQAAQQLEVARIEANKQVRYLSLGVSPVAPDEPTYPRAMENTALAFIIFGGIYLMMSLTASILREQVSA